MSSAVTCCAGLPWLTGCGSCRYPLNDTTLLQSLTATSMVSVLDVLIRYCETACGQMMDVSNSTVTCTGLVSVSYSRGDKLASILHNKQTCLSVLSIWSMGTDDVYDTLCRAYLCGAKHVLQRSNNNDTSTKLIIWLRRTITMMTDIYARV